MNYKNRATKNQRCMIASLHLNGTPFSPQKRSVLVGNYFNCDRIHAEIRESSRIRDFHHFQRAFVEDHISEIS